MEWLYILVPFAVLGVLVGALAFKGPRGASQGPGPVRAGRGFRILMLAVYVGLGLGVPAAVIAARGESEGGVGSLEQASISPTEEEGKRLFRRTCASCHNLDAVNARGVTGPDLDEIGQVSKARVLNAIKIGGTGQKRMPPGLLDDGDAEDVATYVAKVAGR